jgi:FtsZ-interacting cell division protein ZipA
MTLLLLITPLALIVALVVFGLWADKYEELP